MENLNIIYNEDDFGGARDTERKIPKKIQKKYDITLQFKKAIIVD